MYWWAWPLIGWGALATVGSFVLANAAGKARRRERASRAYQYAGELRRNARKRS